jgi:hypothetical protein
MVIPTSSVSNAANLYGCFKAAAASSTISSSYGHFK